MADIRSAVTGIDEILKGLDSLMEIREPVARAMGVAMGTVVRDEAIERAPVLLPENIGFDNQRAGQLKEALYLAYDGRRSILNEGHFVYGVSWNRKKAPHGHLLEFGHFMPYEWEKSGGKFFTPLLGSKRVDGRKRGFGRPNPHTGFFVHSMPFLGPAFDAKLPRLNAIAAAAGAARFSEIMK
jgi:hypothetical protein